MKKLTCLILASVVQSIPYVVGWAIGYYGLAALGVKPLDPATTPTWVFLLLITALLACWVAILYRWRRDVSAAYEKCVAEQDESSVVRS